MKLYHSSSQADYYRHYTGLVIVKYKVNRKSNSLCHVSNDEAGLKFIEGLKKLFPKQRLYRYYRCPNDGQKYKTPSSWSATGHIHKHRAKVIDIRF